MAALGHCVRVPFGGLLDGEMMDILEEAQKVAVILTAYIENFPNEVIKNERKQFFKRHFPEQYGLSPGYVYLMKDAGGTYKIGLSNDSQRRLLQLSRKHKGIELVHCISVDHMEHAESTLHNKFSNQCVRGEWFDLMPTNVAEIYSIVQYSDGEFCYNENRD